MSYPWIKNSKYGTTPSETDYLEVTSPKGLYLNSTTSKVLLKSPTTSESLTISKSALDFINAGGNSVLLIDNTHIHLNEPYPTTTPFTTDITYQNIILQSQNYLPKSTCTNTIGSQSIFLLAPNYTQNIANGTYETTEIATNRRSSLTPMEIRIGYDGISNNGKLYCTDIDSAGNINVVTINGLTPTTTGLVWADFANPYSSLPRNRWFLSDTTSESSLYNSYLNFYNNSNGQTTTFNQSGINSNTTIDIQANGNIINLNCGTLYINGIPYSSGGGGGSQDLGSVLGFGATASTSINMNGQNIDNAININLSTINGSSYPPFPTSPYGLPNVLNIDNTASTSINMNYQDINQVNNINVNSINGSYYPPSVSVPQMAYAMPFQFENINNGNQSIFPSGVTITGGYSYSVVWTFWYDKLYHGGGSTEMIQGYADLYNSSIGNIKGTANQSGYWASATISSNNMYRTTITYTDNYYISSTDTYYPNVLQLNTIGWDVTTLLSAVITRTN